MDHQAATRQRTLIGRSIFAIVSLRIGCDGDLPVDAHELIALCAPRPVFISYGVPEKGDALWLDQPGSFMAAVAAQPWRYFIPWANEQRGLQP